MIARSGRMLLHVPLLPLYALVAIQVWPIALLFALTVLVHLLERTFPGAVG